MDWNTITNVNSSIAVICSRFLDEKDKKPFNLSFTSEDQIRISAQFPKSEPSVLYYFEITKSGCEVYFSAKGKHLYLEVLNEFEDFDSYFASDEEHGSTIAKMLKEKYKQVFADIIHTGEDLSIDEDFQLYFIENFVNYILNNVYIEE